jgi:hypothetical protein
MVVGILLAALAVSGPRFEEHWMELTEGDGSLVAAYRRVVLFEPGRIVSRFEHMGKAAVVETRGDRILVWFPGQPEILAAPGAVLQQTSRQAWFGDAGKTERNVEGAVVTHITEYLDGARLVVKIVESEIGVVHLQSAVWTRPAGHGGRLFAVATGTPQDMSPWSPPPGVEPREAGAGELGKRLAVFGPILFPPGVPPGSPVLAPSR